MKFMKCCSDSHFSQTFPKLPLGTDMEAKGTKRDFNVIEQLSFCKLIEKKSFLTVQS